MLKLDSTEKSKTHAGNLNAELTYKNGIFHPYRREIAPAILSRKTKEAQHRQDILYSLPEF